MLIEQQQNAQAMMGIRNFCWSGRHYSLANCVLTETWDSYVIDNCCYEDQVLNLNPIIKTSASNKLSYFKHQI